MDEIIGIGPGDEELAHEAAMVAVSWVVAGKLTRERSAQLIDVRWHGGSHGWMCDAMKVGEWEKALREPLDGATDDEESRRRVEVAKGVALQEMKDHMLFAVDLDIPTSGSDHPGVRESLRRIAAAAADDGSGNG